MNKTFTLILIFILSGISVLAIDDDFVNKTLLNCKCEKPISYNNYNYEDYTKVPIKLRITENIKDNKVYEGQKITFIVQQDVIYKNKTIISNGTVVKAQVETIITSGMNGIPASIIIGSFCIPNINQNLVTNSYEITGQDRSLIVFPLKWALTILPPTGSLTNFIKGGHAKLKSTKTIEIYYYPNWS